MSILEEIAEEMAGKTEVAKWLDTAAVDEETIGICLLHPQLQAYHLEIRLLIKKMHLLLL